LILLVENDLASASVIVEIEDNPHLFIMLLDDTSNNDDLKVLELIYITSLICCPSISKLSSGVTGASSIIFRVIGLKT
jgi:hypothetical protein